MHVDRGAFTADVLDFVVYNRATLETCRILDTFQTLVHEISFGLAQYEYMGPTWPTFFLLTGSKLLKGCPETIFGSS